MTFEKIINYFYNKADYYIQQHFIVLVCLQAGGSFQETVQTLIKAMKNAEVLLIYSNLKDIDVIAHSKC